MSFTTKGGSTVNTEKLLLIKENQIFQVKELMCIILCLKT